MQVQFMDDADVVRAQGGDQIAFERLMRRHNQRLFRAARAILQDDAEAEDAVQEGYLRAYLGLESYQPGAFGGWVLTIVLNEARGRRRKHARRDELLRTRDPGEARAAPLPSNDPEGALAGGEIRRLVERAIDTLPEEQRIVFVLRELEQLSTRETAELVGSTETAVRSRLHRGKAQLRDALSEAIGREMADAFAFAGSRCDRIVKNVLDRLQRTEGLTH